MWSEHIAAALAVDEVGRLGYVHALRPHSAGVEQETTDQFEAYGRVARREHTRYREGWLPE